MTDIRFQTNRGTIVLAMQNVPVDGAIIEKAEPIADMTSRR
jgi:hypothetical protein